MTRRRRVGAVAAGAVVVVAATAGCLPGGTADAGPPSTVGTVTRVVDVETAVEGTVRVRVIGIDTPETNRPNTPVQCWGPEATNFARAMLDGQRVRMVPDAGQDDVDDDGRALRYLRIGPAETDHSVPGPRRRAQPAPTSTTGTTHRPLLRTSPPPRTGHRPPVSVCGERPAAAVSDGHGSRNHRSA
ncbi:thermonuclease family protein [Rhodococcus sp. NBC_00294]|uniref:thermonuclease family protein n=1 Tax=Rhodococcus sp. NBC_00294 TaxID=2976004 RepID=UPI002E298FE8|nr:thermonuclease family protein [Rhodococcus sp. NBC_00294]